MKEYTEHKKLKALGDRNSTVQNFVEWMLEEKKIVLAEFHSHTESCEWPDDTEEERTIDFLQRPRFCCGYREGELILIGLTLRQLMAEYFDINEAKLEAEKIDMLEELRLGKS